MDHHRPSTTVVLAMLLTGTSVGCSGSPSLANHSTTHPPPKEPTSAGSALIRIPDRQIAFGCHLNEARSSGDICISRVDGSGLKRLTSGPANEFDPSWSPDGSRLAFRSAPNPGAAGIRVSDIWVVSADGTGAKNLTRDAQAGNWSPAWSPDGRHIAYYSEKGGHPGLYLMGTDGGKRTRILDGDAEYPCWSPDGTRLAFMSLGFPQEALRRAMTSTWSMQTGPAFASSHISRARTGGRPGRRTGGPSHSTTRSPRPRTHLPSPSTSSAPTEVRLIPSHRSTATSLMTTPTGRGTAR
jgi:dipeptidyl aminopeptidase/acylaminoacyl peptidase